MPRTSPVRFSRAAFEAMWFDDNLTTDQIAARIGVARTSVSVLGRRMGLPARKTGAKRKVDAVLFTALWNARVSTAEICKAMRLGGRNYPGVIAQSLGLPKRPQGMRGTITWDDYRAMQLRETMAASARETRQALILCEMLDGYRDPRNTGKRAA